MPLLAAIAAILASAAQSEDQPIVVVGHGWAPFVSPMGEPFRPSANEDPFTRWFRQADRNHDAVLTADEMRADAERFFTTLDSNPDGAIDSEERIAYENEIAPEVQVNSRWRRSREETLAQTGSGAGEGRKSRGRRGWDRNVDGYQVNGLQGAARYGLLNLPQPVAAADADFDRTVTLDEFRRAAMYRFQLLDSKQAGSLRVQDLEPLLPSRPKAGRRVNRPKGARDTRIGRTVPTDN